jgi:hypothetical protein
LRRKVRRRSGAVEKFIPYRNTMALVAYYLGVFGLIPGVGILLGPLALILGILGLRDFMTRENAGGIGHAVTGIVLGVIAIVEQVVLIVLIQRGVLTLPGK